MMNITNNQNKATIEIAFSGDIHIQVMNQNYLIVSFKEGKLRIYSNQLCCDFCGNFMNQTSLNYRGFVFCENCFNDIKSGKVGVIP